MITGHDTEGHVRRLIEFNQALNDGHFPVRWAKRLNWGLGYPFFNFNYPGIYYLGEVFNRLGLNFEDSVKAMFLISFPLSGFFTYLWLKERMSKIAAFTGGLFYTLNPYHFLNVYVRGNLGEVVALTLVPLIFFTIEKLLKKPTFPKIAFLTLALSLFILSHNITVMIFMPIFTLYVALGTIFSKQFKKIFIFALSVIWSILITSFFLGPALYYKSITILDSFTTRYFTNHFPSIKSLIYSPWGYGASKVGISAGEMSFQVGLLHLFITLFVLAAITVILLLKNKVKVFKKIINDLNLPYILLFIFLFVFSVFFMTEYSKPIWNLIPLIQYLQFPWRLLMVVALCTAFFAAWSVDLSGLFIPKKFQISIVFCFILLLLFLNRNHWRVNQFYPLPEYWLNAESVTTTTTIDHEHTPIWQSVPDITLTSRYLITSGTGEIDLKIWKTNYHLFEINAKSDLSIIDRTVYYPGWEVFLNKQRIPTKNPTDKSTQGLISFDVPQGNYTVEVKLNETTVNKVFNITSLISLFFLVILFFPKTRKIIKI